MGTNLGKPERAQQQAISKQAADDVLAAEYW